MKQRRLEPDVCSFNAAMSACEKGGQWEKTLQLLDKMQQLHKPDPGEAVRFNRYVITFNAAMSACEKGKQWEKFIQRLFENDSMSNFNAAMSACEKGGQWEKALQLLDEMQQRNLEPDMSSFIAAITASGNCEHYENAQNAEPELSLLSRLKATIRSIIHERDDLGLSSEEEQAEEEQANKQAEEEQAEEEQANKQAEEEQAEEEQANKQAEEEQAEIRRTSPRKNGTFEPSTNHHLFVTTI